MEVKETQRRGMKTLVLSILKLKCLSDIQVDMLTRQLDMLGWGLGENFQKEFKNLRAIKLLVLFKSRQSEITWELSLDRTVF